MNQETKIARLRKLAKMLARKLRGHRKARHALALTLPQVVWNISGIPSRGSVTIRYMALPSRRVKIHTLNQDGSITVPVGFKDWAATWSATTNKTSYSVTPSSGTCDFTTGKHKEISLVVASTLPPAPTVTGISPSTGTSVGGTPVTITGTNLSGATSVKFGVVPAVPTSSSATQVTVITPAHCAQIIDVKVTTAGGTSAISSADHFTFAIPRIPAIDEVAPQSGSTLGGASVIITGTNMQGATSVTFDGIPATIVSRGSTRITLTTPAHAAGLVYIAVITPHGTGVTADVDRYNYVVPSGDFNADFNADFN